MTLPGKAKTSGRWTLTETGILPTGDAFPDFPIARYDSGLSLYQEALLDGQYLSAHLSGMGRAKPRRWIWDELRDGAANDRPLRTRQHAFLIEADGQLLTEGWELVASGGEETHAVLTLLHKQRALKVEVHTRLDGTPFFSRYLTITNVGEKPSALAQVYPWSGQIWQLNNSPDQRIPGPPLHWDNVELANFPNGPFSVARMTDTSPGQEGNLDWMSVPQGRWTMETMHGRSGWGMPLAFVRNDATGEMLVLDLAWSGNWRIELFNDWEPGADKLHVPSARLYAAAGLAGPAPLRVLAPGETVTTPAVHAALIFGDLDEAARALHAHIRESVVPAQPKGREHRIEVNSTGFTRNGQITEAQLYDDIDIAGELGFELYMLDAGWFGGKEAHWATTVGDWDESPLLTKGVAAAFDRVREKGMLAGLWVEPERIGANSRIVKEHPDWLMHRRGKPILNLDLSKPEVARYTEDLIVSIIEKYRLDCFRIDFNGNFGEGGSAERDGYSENVVWRYYDALHGIFDRIRRRFPNLLLENCSSGGGRMDLGMMSRFHWTQVTDRWSPGPSLKIINGSTLGLPPELCESVMGGISEGVSEIDFLIRANLFTHFKVTGVTANLSDKNDASWARWQHGFELYRSFCRPMLSSARLFHHTPIQNQNELGEWVVLENATPGKDMAYLGIFRLPGARGDDILVRPRGLDAGRRYRVRYDSAGYERTLDGGALMDEGLRIRIASALRSELLLIEAV
jgi:alpha-galactosidase